MVQQPNILRRALGRSAWEPPFQSDPSQQETISQEHPASHQGIHSEYTQLYNARGYPQNPPSRALIKQSIRAYNEVLEVVGVCAKTDRHGKLILGKSSLTFTADQDEAIMEENEAGFWLELVQNLITATAITAVNNLRRRIITFAYYSGIPFRYIVKTEIRQGPVQFFLAGEVAGTVYDLLQTFFSTAIELISEALQDGLTTGRPPLEVPDFRVRVVRATEQILQYAVPCALWPLHILCESQRLGLLPVWPLLPNPFSAKYFNPLLPPTPRTWDRPSIIAYSTSLALSPAVTYTVMYYFTNTAIKKLQQYGRAAMIRPDNPDSLSMRIFAINEFGESAKISGYDKYQCTLGDQLTNDLKTVQEAWYGLYSRCQRVLKRVGTMTNFNRPVPVLTAPRTTRLDQDRPEDSWQIVAPPALRRNGEGRSLHSLPYHSPTLPLATHNASRRASAELATATPTDLPWASANLSTTTAASPILTPPSVSTEEEAEDDEANTSTVRVRTRAGSTSTIHVDVEIHTTNRDELPETPSSTASSNHPQIVETNRRLRQPLHRVTTLSLHGVDSLSYILVRGLISIIRLPLESLYLRSTAQAFLLQQVQPHWLLSEVYPMDSWFGHGIHAGRANIMDYIGKVLLCVGWETLVAVQIWKIGSHVAVWWGRNVYGWESL